MSAQKVDAKQREWWKGKWGIEKPTKATESKVFFQAIIVKMAKAKPRKTTHCQSIA